MKTIELNLYEFNELSDVAKEVAIEFYMNINVHDGWYEHVSDKHKDLIEKAGFDIKDIYYTGFWSQGDGAMFTYKGLENTLLHQAVDTLQLPEWKKRVLKNGYLSGRGIHSGMYYHYNSCDHQIYLETDNGVHYYKNIEELFATYEGEVESYIKDLYKTLCDSLYRDLSNTYDELTSREAVIEGIEANEYLFLESGKCY